MSDISILAEKLRESYGQPAPMEFKLELLRLTMFMIENLNNDKLTRSEAYALAHALRDFADEMADKI